jgi:Protein of unknown function (DUF3106)
MRTGESLAPPLLLLGLAAAVALAVPGLGPAADSAAGPDAAPPENWVRLRAMPREHRQALWDKIKEFDNLGRPERDAIRALDARIAQLPPADRANYWSLLRRYHRWIQGLSQEQRDALNAAPADQRMRLVTQFRAEDRSAADADATPLFLQVVDFTLASPFESAHMLRAWFDLKPEKRAELERMSSTTEQKKSLTALGQHSKLGPPKRPAKAEEDKLLEKIDADPRLKSWMSSAKKADAAKNDKARRRLAENYYFIQHPPASVDPGNLMRFESALPRWYRDQFEYLPPEEARRRLAILYRLVFPAPSEMPESRRSPAAPAPATRPAAAPGTNPF